MYILKMKAAFLSIFVVFLLSNIYVAFRLWQLIPANNLLRTALIGIMLIGFLSTFIFFIFGESLPINLSSLLYKIGTSWMIAFFYLFLFVVILDLFWLSASIFKFVSKDFLLQYFRHSTITSSILFVALGSLLLYGYINYNHKKRVHIPITTSKVENPMRIVAVSDLHLGYTIGKKELSRWIKLINKEKPDMVLIAGDLIDNQLRPVNAQLMFDELNKIDAPMGVFACTGNHEYISGIKESSEFFNKAGITLLRDSTATVGDITIIGREDFTYKNRKPLADITKNIDSSTFSILLDHQPNALGDAADANIDMQISGHTHYGQVFPASLVTKKLFEVAHGYIKKQNTHIYVSSGLGIWGGKFRIGTQSEYLVIEIGN